MAFTHGRDARVYVNGYDLTTYLRSTSAQGRADVAEASTFGTSDKVYVAGMKDAVVSAGGIFSGGTAEVDDVFRSALGVEQTEWNAWPQGDTLGNRGWQAFCQQTRYEIDAPVDNVVSVSAEAQSSSGYESTVSLHALGAESAAGTAGSVNIGGTTTNGWAAHLHITAKGGAGTGQIILQHSTAATGTYLDLGTFAFAAGAGTSSQRLTGTGSVNAWVRCALNPISAGTITYNVAFARK